MHNPIKRMDKGPKGTGFFSVLKSVIAAIFGIQSGANRERDFKEGRAGDYIWVGVVVTVVIVIAMIILVKIVLSNAGH